MAQAILVIKVGAPLDRNPNVQPVTYLAFDGTFSYVSRGAQFPVGQDPQTYATANAADLFLSAQQSGQQLPSVIVNGMVLGNTQAYLGGIVGYTGDPFVLSGLQIFLTTVTTITTGPTITVGTSSGASDILPATQLSRANHSVINIPLPLVTPFFNNPLGTPFWVNVTVAAVGTGTPAFQFTVAPIGALAFAV